MAEKSPFLPLVEKFFDHDTTAAHSLERMPEEEAVDVLRAWTPPNARVSS